MNDAFGWKTQWQLYEVDGGIRVYQNGGDFVVADGGGWVPGVYETFGEAVQAARDIRAGCYDNSEG